MAKQNILLVAGVFPPGIGGMQNYYYNLCKYSKHNMTVLASEYDGQEAFDARQPFRIVRRPFLRNEKPKIVGTLRLFGQVRKLIKQEQIDVTIYGYILYGLIGYLLHLFSRRKPAYAVSVHGMDVMMLTRFMVMRWIIRRILGRAASVMVNSGFTKQLMLDLGVEENKVDIVYPGLEDGFERGPKDPELTKQLGLEGCFVMMTLGRLVERKGFDMAVRALPLIREKVPNAVYLIVGEGPERGNLERTARECGVEHAVIFAGAAPNGESSRYYNLSDVFIMPSRYKSGDVEGFGIVFLEAGSCYKPVVGGNTGGIREAVLDGETGLLIDPNSKEEIAAAIVRIAKDPGLAKSLAAKGYARAKGQFHYRIIAKGFDRLLSQLKARKPTKWMSAHAKRRQAS